jgi:NitT/TauT family transport system substrate-binding protein
LLVGWVWLFAGCGTVLSKSAVVKIGVLPIEDNLPFFVAEQNGLFQDAGLEVELIPFPSAVERDAALQAGQIDGAIADLVAVSLLSKGGTDIRVVCVGMGALPAEGRFAILSAPHSQIRQPEDLRDVPIGVSENSIIDYVTDVMLADAHIPAAQVQKIAIPKMPVRLQMLMADEIQAACLPDPLAYLAERQGAHTVLEDTYRHISQTVLFFRNAVLQDRAPELQALVRVYERAGQDINASPDQYRPLLISKTQVPEEIAATYPMPVYSLLRLPEEDEVTEVMQWMVDKKLLDQAYAYQDLIDASLLK